MSTLDPVSDQPRTYASFGGALSGLGRSLSRQIDTEVAETGLSADLWYVLVELISSDGISMTELSRRLSVPAPTVTKLVDRLVTEALAFRLVDETDRRRVLVHASRRGDALHRSLIPKIEHIETEFRSNLVSADRSLLVTLLGET